MADFSLKLTLDEHGSVEAVVKADTQQITVWASYIADPCAILASALLSFLPMRRYKVTCSWMDEPGEYRWVFQPDGERVRIRLRRFEEAFSPLPEERGECLFETTCSPRRLAAQVKGALHQLLNEHGEEGYQSRCRRPFPMTAFRRLEAFLEQEKERPR